MNFTKFENRSVWYNDNKTVFIVLPDDKKTYRVTDLNGNRIIETLFRSFEKAVLAASKS